MLNKIRHIDAFSKNVFLVFLGTSLMNAFNLIFQLLVAHRLDAVDFAAFSALLAIFMIFSAPLNTLQTAVAKFGSEFNALKSQGKITFLLSDLFKKAFFLGILTLIIFSLSAGAIVKILKIDSLFSGYMLAMLLAVAWLNPVLLGGIQGLEYFRWFSFSSIAQGGFKLLFGVILISMGYAVAGAIGAFLLSSILCFFIFYMPIRKYINARAENKGVDYKEILFFLLPIAVSNLCFYILVSFDVILVKYYFGPLDAGFYSLAQIVGKIFLFLPYAISVVLLPKVSGLNACKLETTGILKRSLLYASTLCVIGAVIYNLFPAFLLTVFTGKAFPESIILGRLFSFSMTFFALLFVLITYFLSIKDLRFIKYLSAFTVLQIAAIIIFHKSIFQVQYVICLNAVLLFVLHLGLAGKPKRLCLVQ